MKPHVSKVTALFLLSQVFLIITHVPLVRLLAWIIFHGDANIFTERGAARIMEFSSTTSSSATSRKKAPTNATAVMPTTMVSSKVGEKPIKKSHHFISFYPKVTVSFSRRIFDIFKNETFLGGFSTTVEKQALMNICFMKQKKNKKNGFLTKRSTEKKET